MTNERYFELQYKYTDLQKAFDETLEMNRKLGSENWKLEKENEQLKAKIEKMQEDFELFKKGKVCALCNYNTVGQDEYIDNLEEQLKELEAQNEKMQCCFNCKHYNQVRCCRNDDKCIWELAE